MYQLVGMAMIATELQHASKRKLLAAAFDVIRTRGYSATRVEDICEEAGVTKGSFFHHFRTKEELALEAAAYWSAVTGELFRQAPYHAPADPLDRLLAYVDFRKALLRGELPQFTCLMGTMVQEVYETWPAIRDACAASIAEHAATLEPDIAAAMEKYCVQGDWTPRSLALHTQAVIQGSFILAKAQGGAAVAAESLDHLRRYIELLFMNAAQSSEHTDQKEKCSTPKELSNQDPGETTLSQPPEELTMAATTEIRLTEKADTKELPAMHYIFVERVGNIPQNAPQAWMQLIGLAAEIEKHSQILRRLSLYRMEDGLYRAGFQVAEKPVHLPEGVRYEHYAGGKFHRFVLTGPFSQLGPATRLAVERVREQKLPLRNDFNIENYLTDPRTTPEDEHITEILFPAA
jgi:TetR/AcrR family transcriptional regulator, transcriptional repressor for nem operon